MSQQEFGNDCKKKIGEIILKLITENYFLLFFLLFQEAMSHDVYVSVLFILNCIGLFYVFFVSPMIACLFVLLLFFHS